MLDTTVQDFLHLGATGIGDDAAIAERAGTPFGATLIPAKYFGVSDDRGALAHQSVVGKFRDGKTNLRSGTFLDGCADFRSGVGRAPVGMLHFKGARLSKGLMPDVIG